MKLKKYILNEATKNMNSMLDFIMKNKNFIQYDHQVEELWQSVATAKFKKDTGFYPTISRWEWKIADLGWELKNTDKMNYEDILKDLREGEEFLVLGAPKEANEQFEPYFLDFHKRQSVWPY